MTARTLSAVLPLCDLLHSSAAPTQFGALSLQTSKHNHTSWLTAWLLLCLLRCSNCTCSFWRTTAVRISASLNSTWDVHAS